MLERLKEQVSPHLQARRWLIAYSGGLDSHVLLHAMVELIRQYPHYPPLVALHINHQIQSVANDWEEHCRAQALACGVEYRSIRVNVDSSCNVEEHAREARYAAFADVMQEGDCVFLAHHQQDNIENFLYRLFRGAGIKGLLSMPPVRLLGKGLLVRPFLTFDRSQLEQYARQHQLSYVDDLSNLDVSFDRNYIRHCVLPVILHRWKAFNAAIQRLLENLHEADVLLDELAQHDLRDIDYDDGFEPSIGVHAIRLHSLPRQKNLLRYWLAAHGLTLSSRQNRELFHCVIQASEDAMPELSLGSISIRRYRSRIYITHNQEAGFEDIQWNGLEQCVVPGYGVLSLSRPLDVKLVVKARQGGEVIKPANCAHSRKLKTLLQELAVPPWRRGKLPLVYADGHLLSVAELVRADIADEYLPDSIICRS